MAFIWKLKPWVSSYIKTGRNYIFKRTQVPSFILSYSTSKYHCTWVLGCMVCLVWVFFKWSTTYHCNFSNPNIRQSDFLKFRCQRSSASHPHLLFSRYRITLGTDLLCSFTFTAMWFSPRQGPTRFSTGFPHDLEFLKTSAGQPKTRAACFHVGCAGEWVCKKPAEWQGYLHNPWPGKFSLPQGTFRGRMN